jgi:uncharacterized protein
MKELYITYEDIHFYIKKIADEIKMDNWDCDVIVGISSGGFIPARLLKSFLKKDVLIVGLKRYNNENAVSAVPEKIQWIDEVEKKIKNKKILLVDEIDDTRVTLYFCVKELLKNGPEEIRIAVIHNKLKEKIASFPDEVKKVYIGRTIEDIWLRYPWEATDIIAHNKKADLQNNSFK